MAASYLNQEIRIKQNAAIVAIIEWFLYVHVWNFTPVNGILSIERVKLFGYISTIFLNEGYFK